MVNNRNKLFYVVKIIRLNKGFKILDEHVIMTKIKAIWKSKIENKIKKDP